MIVYVDTSALVKTVVEEEGSAAVLALLEPLELAQVWSSALTRTELVRAVARDHPELVPAARGRLAMTTFVTITRQLLDDAGALAPAVLRSLDAVHLATALSLGSDLDAVLTYDDRMADAARSHGLTVLAPT